jgi:hypothetical protein
MKKFFVSLLIILILGGVVFFLGWVQFAVPPGSYGVMRSKTHGLEKELIRNGEFRWEWYKVIPGNAEIIVFSPKTVSLSFSEKGSLPSGAVYTAVAGINADFSYEIAGDLSFSIKTDSLADLVETNGVTTQEELDSYGNTLAASIETFITGTLKSPSQSAGIQQIIMQNNPAELVAAVSRNFPGIDNITLKIRTPRFPDFALYNSVKALYETYIEKQRELLNEPVSLSAENHLRARFRFDELEKYGELLTKYPVLLNLLSLEKNLPALNGLRALSGE